MKIRSKCLQINYDGVIKDSGDQKINWNGLDSIMTIYKMSLHNNLAKINSDLDGPWSVK